MHTLTTAKHALHRLIGTMNPNGLCQYKHWLAGTTLAVLLLITPTAALLAAPDDAGDDAGAVEIPDRYIRAFRDLVYDQRPPRPVPGRDYGMIADFTQQTVAEVDEQLNALLGEPSIPLPGLMTLTIPILGTPYFVFFVVSRNLQHVQSRYTCYLVSSHFLCCWLLFNFELFFVSSITNINSL